MFFTITQNILPNPMVYIYKAVLIEGKEFMFL